MNLGVWFVIVLDRRNSCKVSRTFFVCSYSMIDEKTVNIIGVLSQAVMEWRQEDPWPGGFASTGKWVPASHTATTPTNTPTLVLLEPNTMAVVPCPSTGLLTFYISEPNRRNQTFCFSSLCSWCSSLFHLFFASSALFLLSFLQFIKDSCHVM